MKRRKSKTKPRFNSSATRERRKKELSIMPPSATAFLRLEEVAAMTSLSTVTIWRLRDEKTDKALRFPEPYRIGPKRVGWLRSEIEEWIKQRQVACV